MVTAEGASDDLPAGQVIANRLWIEALLGEGGTAAVYRVRDQRDGRKLALKLLRAPDDERRALLTSQFEREYHTLSQLAHPRIIEVVDYGREQGTPYYTMELLDGEDLHERGQLPWRQACSLLCDVASSLAMLHSRGLIHRDVSARNVRCTSDGHAKLLDFGAMVSVGASYRPIGTPPFVPPEAMQLQALDGRADLYGLGALAYWMLTGRHAYPAHTLNQLRDVWRTPPRNPGAYVRELPEALAELVMALLRLDRSERPRSAAEVMERLSGIAGLSLQELPQVGRAYFITPVLIGRETALSEARAALLSSMQGAGGSALLIEGAAGIGRSRLLDACVLEAKLMGATVVRASPAEGRQTPYGVAAALGSQLLSMLPAECQQNAAPRLALLAHVLPELAPPGPLSKQDPERRHLQAALRDWLLAISREQHVVIAVDDVQAIDEPSAALLGALAHGAKRRQLTLLLTARGEGPASQVLRVLRELSRSLVLQPLVAGQTEALLRSLFGDAGHIAPLAERIHGLSLGHPRRILALAEHLVARGAARYEAGSWRLPADASAADLPQSERDAIFDKLGQLGADARELAQALALTDPSALSLPGYPVLTAHADVGRTFAALDELLAAGLLLAEGDHYRPLHEDVFAPLALELDQATRRELHVRLARALQGSPKITLRQLHMLRGDTAREAIDALLAAPPDTVQAGLLEVLACAAEVAERLGFPSRMQLMLHHRLVRLSAVVGHHDLFTRFAWTLIDRLERDSGVRDYYEFDADLDPAPRLSQALARAQQRHDTTPESERGFAPQDSLMMLVALHGSCATLSGIALDVTVMERLRSLEPFNELSPLMGLMQMAAVGQRAVHAGRFDLAHQVFRRLLTALELPGSREASRFFRLGTIYAIAALEAYWGQAACLDSVSALDQQPGYRGRAWRVRAVYHLSRGDVERARECQRRAELLDLQDMGGVTVPATGVESELWLAARLGDLLALKRCVERIEPLAAAYPGWQLPLAIAHSHYKLVQEDVEGAFAVLMPALIATTPGRHRHWGLAAEAHVLVLCKHGRHAEACEHAQAYLATCDRLGLEDDAPQLKRAAAEALLPHREVEQACRYSEESLAWLQRLGIRGVWLGIAHETRARVAIVQRDQAVLREHAELCAREYGAGRNPSLTAKYERLLREAASAGMPLVEVVPEVVQDEATRAAEAARTVYSRMLTCISPDERAQRGLQLVLEATGAEAGYLFGLRSGKLQAMASSEPAEVPVELKRMLDDFVRREFEEGTELPGASADVRAGRLAAMERFVDELSREFEPLLLSGRHHGEAMIAGVAALHFRDDERAAPRAAMLDAVIEALIADDVVDPITCVA